MSKKPYRDGLVHVCTTMCSTCVFRPGNLMHLRSGRLRNLVDGNLAGDTALTCHQTLYGGHPAGEAVCRGYFDAYAQEVTPLRLAVALGVVTNQDPEDHP